LTTLTVTVVGTPALLMTEVSGTWLLINRTSIFEHPDCWAAITSNPAMVEGAAVVVSDTAAERRVLPLGKYRGMW